MTNPGEPQVSERDLIARLRRQFPRAGDDAAVIGSQVITVDMLVEGVDFTLDIPLRFVGRKSVSVNLSDLAAMGAEPQHAVVAVAAPTGEIAMLVMDGVAEAASQYGLEIVGGDVSRCSLVVVAVTAVGFTERPLLRSGARPGERLYVSRPLGGPAVGLTLLQCGWRIRENGEVESPPGLSYAARELGASAILRHVDPEPEIVLARALSSAREITSCIDISDGLSADTRNLCEASGCGAEIDKTRIPVFADLPAHGRALGIDIAEAVLQGGEEYALLFTSGLRESELSARLSRPVYAIGKVTEGSEVTLNDGERSTPLDPRGWDHFVR